MSDAHNCFQFISNNAPEWISILESLERKVKERQDHISRVPVPARRLKKTGSNESIRPKSDSEDIRSGQVEVLSAPQDNDLANPIHPQHLLLNSRKRKTASVLSNDSAAPAKYRTRSMIVVYYDSEIQKSFEQIVRYIGTARNSIRKARTAHRMELLASGQAFNLLGSSPRSGYAPLALFASARGPSPRPEEPGANSGDRPTDTFASTDAALEKAQSLCERGAHQFLREGDCEAEIIGAKESFEEAKRLSDRELARLKVESEKRQQEQDSMEREAVMQTQQEEEKESSSPKITTIGSAIMSAPLEADDDPSADEDLNSLLQQLPKFGSRRGVPRTIAQT